MKTRQLYMYIHVEQRKSRQLYVHQGSYMCTKAAICASRQLYVHQGSYMCTKAAICASRQLYVHQGSYSKSKVQGQMYRSTVHVHSAQNIFSTCTYLQNQKQHLHAGSTKCAVTCMCTCVHKDAQLTTPEAFTTGR